jgi:predicted Rossmann fold flavoprotein
MRVRSKMKNIAIIGAGAAGLMAAGRAAERGHRVFVFEKNNCAGKKLRITGKGRCNITNVCDIDTFILNVPGNGKFMHSAIHTFSNANVMDFFENKGLKLKTERGGRVFPESDNAEDVVKVLVNYALSNNASIKYKCAVREIVANKGIVTGIKLKSEEYKEFDAVILTTGGVSYPGTGSTGEGHKMAQKLGHTITPLKPSLVPLEVNENWVKQLQGLSLKNVSIRLEGHFCRFFKRLVRKTPVEYINYYRVNRAVKLLENEDAKIIEIAMDVGFDSFSYFISMFKRYMKCTPSQYRKSKGL